MKKLLTIAVIINSFFILNAQTLSTPVTSHIHVDQFGYLPAGNKVAVISDPQTGFNAAKSYTPATSLSVHDATNNNLINSFNRTSWNGNATHGQSGDKGWWLDFSTITTPGSYYIYDAQNGRRSNVFEIKADVYKEVIKAATKMFYYNRCNMAKIAPYADTKWIDATNNFHNANQDLQCRYYNDVNNASLIKNLSGGWFDAGDYNKYITFASRPMHDLLLAFEINPLVFGDNWNIPESSNGIADLLDEIKWELDWMKKMQNNDGSVIIKMGSISYSHNAASPPSNNYDPRYYGLTCTSAAIALGSVFAHAANVLSNVPQLATEATVLKDLAIKSWDFVLPSINNNTLQTNCDDGTIKSGDADRSVAEQKEEALVMAFYLYKITGNETYHTYFKNHLTDAAPIANNWMGTNNMPLNNVLMQYTTETFAHAATKTEILNSLLPHIQGDWDGFYRWNNNDLYRANMPDWAYHWGSNMQKANFGILASLVKRYNLDASNNVGLARKTEEQLHYFHGVNPMNLVYLSNMYQLGAEECANEMYHSWFNDGTIYDHALTSTKGPAPGFVTGGPNKDYTYAPLNPPFGQPMQKAYLDFNTTSPANSWEITEPAIYYQAAYILLLSNFAPVANVVLPITISDFKAKNEGAQDVLLTWELHSTEPISDLTIQKSASLEGLWLDIPFALIADAYISRASYLDRNVWSDQLVMYYRLKITNEAGEEKFSEIQALQKSLFDSKNATIVFPNPGHNQIQINTPNQIAKLMVYDILGKLSQTIERPSTTLEISNLMVGSYILELQFMDGKRERVVFEKR